MRKFYALAMAAVATASFAQFDREIDTKKAQDLLPSTLVMPQSPLDTQVVFIGGVSMVETNKGKAVAKEWNDFIGLTPSGTAGKYHLTVNHEMVIADDKIGDGGGMTTFLVEEKTNGEIVIVEQTINNKKGKFFNVDFEGTVGNTGMNCGGISAPNGRIWTAEEWWRANNKDFLYLPNGDTTKGIRDTSDFTVSKGWEGTAFEGATVKAYENLNYMVEIDPKTAKAIRKQYNWGRFSFEGGAILDDSVVYLGIDGNPAPFIKFVANKKGDFTTGNIFAFAQDSSTKWIQLSNSNMDQVLNTSEEAWEKGATMFNRLEWVAIDKNTGKVYIAETGRDDIGKKWSDENAKYGVKAAKHHMDRATDMGVNVHTAEYSDLYGRVLVFDPATDEMKVHLEAGAPNDMRADLDNKESVAVKYYPAKHLSNPDGLSFIYVKNKTFMVIQEDLNGETHNRVPYGISNKNCEIYFLDMSIENPDVSDLIRISAVPHGAEVTGAVASPSGNVLFVNSQHPNSNEMVNDFPFNHSVTVAISGFDALINGVIAKEARTSSISIYPNPVARELTLSEVADIAIYNVEGKRVLVSRNTTSVDVSSLSSGSYIIRTSEGESLSFIVE